MKRAVLCLSVLCTTAACSGLPALTSELLSQASRRWDARKPNAYRLVIEMSGDRVETGRFEVDVRGGQTVSLRRNGLIVRPNPGQDYTMEGLFHMLEQELGLAEKPAMMGAPPGYAVYMSAKFDDATGRLIRYRRSVGGASNSIEINVLVFKEN